MAGLLAVSASLVEGQVLSRMSALASPCPFCPDQLALDIDRDAEDQNRYLDGMVRVCDVYECRGQLCPVLPALAPTPRPQQVMEAAPV